MQLISINEMFGNPWGVVAHRRKEIEQGSYGVLQRIFKEELNQIFLTLPKVAEMMDCCESTARDWLAFVDARYFMDANRKLYFVEDAQEAKTARAESKQKAK